MKGREIMADVFVKGKKVSEVADDLTESPEDAIWCRDLEDIFWKGVTAGLLADTKQDVEIKNVTEIY